MKTPFESDSGADLARACQELKQLIILASHDLREPARTMAGYAHLLARHCGDQLDESGREFLQQIVNGSRRLTDQLDDLLRLAVSEAAGTSFEPVDCDALLLDVLANLRARVWESEAEVTWAPLPTVTGNRSLLTSLFQNLLDNAMKYRGRLPPRIHVEAGREQDAWRFSVRDHGPGFEASEALCVFEMFRRLDEGSQHEGTGLGLAICKRVVEYHGGRISAESVNGQGATFHFTLPDSPVCRKT